jgi:hypothetical protein
MRICSAIYLFTCSFVCLSVASFAQTRGNLDESKVGQYTLPPLLIKKDGSKVKNAVDWEQHQRPDILKLFAENVLRPHSGPTCKYAFQNYR